MNQIVLVGRLTRDPELRHTPTGTPVASFSVAVDRRYSKDAERKTDFIDCVAWRSNGEFVAKYFTKGKLIGVVGRLETRDWTDKEGNKRRSFEVNCDSIEFVGGKNEGSTGGYTGTAKTDYNSGYSSSVPSSDFAELEEDDGDLPF